MSKPSTLESRIATALTATDGHLEQCRFEA